MRNFFAPREQSEEKLTIHRTRETHTKEENKWRAFNRGGLGISQCVTSS